MFYFSTFLLAFPRVFEIHLRKRRTANRFYQYSFTYCHLLINYFVFSKIEVRLNVKLIIIHQFNHKIERRNIHDNYLHQWEDFCWRH